MSFSPNSFCKKLDVLQETQESIVSISQWVLFHQKHCKESAKTWAEYIIGNQHSSNKKLSLLYLCNDVVQQARRKRKQEFITEFARVLPMVLQKIYPSVDSAIRAKIDRLVGVWQQRNIFDNNDIEKMKSSLSKQEPVQQVNQTGSKDSVVADLKHINDLYNHLNQLTDLSQANLTQFGIQSKTYLPNDPSGSDNLPAPRQYIAKLNMLDELSKVSINSIGEIKNTKLKIKAHLDNLSRLLSESIKTEDSKIGIINEKIARLNNTRDELRTMLEGGESKPKQVQQEEEEEEESPVFEAIADDDDDDDLLPTYEDDDDVKEDNKGKRRYSQTSSGGSTPTSKRVSFSEDIEVKEFDRDEESNEVDTHHPPPNEAIAEMIHHHKDSVELKHEHDALNGETNGDGPTNEDVMSLLSKLA
ncbi:hypothetical protein JA1_005062 [Spathaspora sp. JA1]|nr:hypothetical protein JA1_005062 [Spathaspora sp. JA1]